ncbi:MAG: acetate--CoA ligase family protein [Caulobacteraceae bacterium]|nr:acetate--CoA ligase family protein [Caulobacteraceae bacterium]
MFADPNELRQFFSPRGIVIFGKVDVEPGAVERNRRFGVPFCHVNPNATAAPAGVSVYASADQVPDDYEVAVVRVRAPGVPAIVEDCARRGIRKIFVFSSGYSEQGPEGEALEAELAQVVRRTGVLLIGPNTTENALEPMPAPPGYRGGRIGLVTHSGGQGRAIIEGAVLGAGFSRWVALGNEVGIDACDMINYFAHDPETAVIAAYVEGFKSGPRLRAALAAANAEKKPIVVLKMGATEKGAEVAASHTGHLAGADAPVDGLFTQHGVVRVRDLDELLETANLFAKLPSGTGVRCGMYSYSGANAAIMSEVADSFGVPIPTFTAATQASLAQLLPPNQRISNPIDNGGVFSMASPMDRRMEVLNRVAADPNIDLIVFGVGAAYPVPAKAFSAEIPAWVQQAAKPAVAVYSSPKIDSDSFTNTLSSGVPIFRSFRGCFQALKAFERHQAWTAGARLRVESAKRLGPAGEAALARPGILSAAAASALLDEAGISLAREVLTQSGDEARAAAQVMGGAVVMKLMSPDFPHKSDAGLVRRDLVNGEVIAEVYESLIDRARDLAPTCHIDGVLVQEQIGNGVEMIIGVTLDPLLGPTLTIGAGGLYAEIFEDAAVRPLPIDAGDLREMISSLKVAKLLAGARGAKAADVEGFIDMALKVAVLAEAAGGRIAELDLNPVIVSPHRAVAVDALVVAGAHMGLGERTVHRQAG